MNVNQLDTLVTFIAMVGLYALGIWVGYVMRGHR